jgi:hypothetical protein
MPQLLVRGISVAQLQQISESLVTALAELCQCGTDNFMIEAQPTTSIFAGKIVETFPFIEVSWFDRGAFIRDQFAQIITEHLLALGIMEVEIAFVVYREDSYYINGLAFNHLAD